MLLVVDASVVVKWVVEEEGTSEALAVRRRAKLIAPDLLTAECANILWKKVVRGELPEDEALIAAALLEKADVELYPMRSSFAAATRLAIELEHPAYDCLYLTLALTNRCRVVTADRRFHLKVGQSPRREIRAAAMSLGEAARL